MPFRRRARALSASGRLDTRGGSSVHSGLLSVDGGTGIVEDGTQPELLKQNRRRRSRSLDNNTREPHHRSTHLLKDIQAISLDNLEKLQLEFEEFEKGDSKPIDEERFGRILRKCFSSSNMNNAQIQELFKKIDYLGQGGISWGDFCSHMLQLLKVKEETVQRGKQVSLSLPATMRVLNQSSPVVNIRHHHDGTILTLREDGAVCCWSPELKLQNTKQVLLGAFSNRKSKWANDFAVMSEYDKLLMGTGDREIQLYELSTLEPYCQINSLDTVPLTVDCSYTGKDQCCIVYGDAEGCVNIILISSVLDTLRLWNKFPMVDNMPSIAIDRAVLSANVRFVRWKAHQDWVTQVKYLSSFQMVVSSSCDEASSLVIGRILPLTDVQQQLKEITEACYEGKTKKVQLSWTPQLRASSDQTVFSVYKGVKTFDLCQRDSLLVTGGMGGLINMWNPLFPAKPTGILKGHSAPITYLYIASEDAQIFSVSTDSTVKIWDIEDQCCLFTANPEASRIHGELSACSYSPVMKSLYIAADCMAVLSLQIRPRRHRNVIVSHDAPVTCCGYSQEFRQVVSCTEDSVVKVWDIDTGRQLFEFGGTPDLSPFTCMTFDLKGRRLITGGKDGCLKMWNFNSGQCLKTLTKVGKSQEVCDCIYLKVHGNFFVMSVGRDRKIEIYPDIPEDRYHLQKPQRSWTDALTNGHKDDILCMAHCPPSFLATSSYNGEIIVWNVVSGHIHCRFASPLPAEYQNTEGPDTSVPSIIFCKIQQDSSAPTLLTSGSEGCINLWNVLGEGRFEKTFNASRFQQKITKMSKTDTLLYAADRIGYVYVYNLFDLSCDKQPPRVEIFWRAHTNRITGLQIVDNDRVVLTSSTDLSVRLWSASGEFIGTFGQAERWNLHTPSSWMHPAVPYEVLIDPQSTPDHGILGQKLPGNQLNASL
ncbi:WD repeat-containing protein 64 [Synchiropus splendidus]|uniref:WD repeat-containing protein 64 n=1 Tax=Synchiropus splendidus TaxID=270530 RepID=UPI00237DA31B|nr:WD repeat-containing protein 64 [Synchiropus splendidus]